jgi:hypothetical protein
MYRKKEFHEFFCRKHKKKPKKPKPKVTIYLSILNSYHCEENVVYSIEGMMDMTGLKGTMTVTITPPTGDVTTMSVDTADDGTFAVQFLAAMEGKYDILVEYAGESPYQSSSAKISVNVVPVPVPTAIILNGPPGDVQVGQTVSVTGTLGY